ncbi:MAG TPA: hypothetical protein VFE33_01805 [Thermoanaerobaculia bacterium]|nr:hypothetical protein [Thermoanaerobaculia bacterium]
MRSPFRRIAAVLLTVWGMAASTRGDSLSMGVLPGATADDPVQIVLTGTSEFLCLPLFGPAVRQGETLTIAQRPTQALCPPPGTPQVFHDVFPVGPLPAGTYTVQVVQETAPTFQLAVQTFTVGGPPVPFSLQQGRFTVEVTRAAPPAGTVPAHPVGLTDESAYFWFFSPDNVELTLKVLDGRAVNGHFWVFLASMTDVEYTVTLTEHQGGCGLAQGAPSCPFRSYHSPGHGNRNFIDVNAF